MNIKGQNKTEEQALEAKQVLLYGLNKVGSKILKKYEADYKPTKRAYVRKTPKEEVKEVKKVRVYDPEESDYDVSDLPFLNSEYERISKLEMTEENEDLQDKLYDVIDQIESIDKYFQSTCFNIKRNDKRIIKKPQKKIRKQRSSIQLLG